MPMNNLGAVETRKEKDLGVDEASTMKVQNAKGATPVRRKSLSHLNAADRT
jgi:hypothetical protein